MRTFRHILLLGALLAGFANSAMAHVGPPFPILMDQPVSGYNASVWADPDIGEALFYVVLEPGPTNRPPDVSKAELWTQPVNGRLDRRSFPMVRQNARGHVRFLAQPEFDIADFWKVGVEIRLVDGSAYSLVAEVESTPPGLGPWGLLVYLFPFVLFGGLWAMVFVRRTRRKRIQAEDAELETRRTGLERAKLVAHASR